MVITKHILKKFAAFGRSGSLFWLVSKVIYVFNIKWSRTEIVIVQQIVTAL